MKHLLLIVVTLISLTLNAQSYLNLEKVPSSWKTTKGASLKASTAHYKMGNKSIAWKWNSEAKLTINEPLGLDKAPATYKGGMMLWIYNETPQNTDITFDFIDEQNITQYTFEYHIDFQGWRACWLRFDEDMKGIKKNKDLKTIVISAPAIAEGGTLFFDRMKFPKGRVHDRVTPDKQLPNINPEMNYNHWAALWHWENTYKYETPAPKEYTIADQKDIDAIRERITESIKGKALSESLITKTTNQFLKLNIRRHKGQIIGVPLVMKDEYVKGSTDRHFEHIDKLIYNLAKGWYHNQADGFDDMFIDLLDWMYDQGFTYGSGMGTNHHYGYQFRNIPKSMFLMSDALKEHKKYEPALEMIQYWTGVPEIRRKPETENFQGIIDTWNTVAIGRLIAIVMDTDDLRVKRNMELYAQWMGYMTEYSVGIMGGLKPDGAGFHHGMLYVNYMNGGYSGIGEILNYLGFSAYRFPEASLLRLKKAFMLHTWYANTTSVANSMSGRHPLEQSISKGSINALAYLAKSFDPIDKELAGEYLRLSSSKSKLHQEFLTMGITPATTPHGNRSINYGALNLHRRDNWLVTTKGFNSVVTGTEIYSKNNRYGRYQAYGAVQILGTGDPVSAHYSGIAPKGWDWNRNPGTTTIHLPYNKLDWYKKGNINERSKTETFAGAVSMDGNGAWGMKLHENDYKNYTPDFVARKSVFTFENRIICLGSNISNSNEEFNTETTLFQSHLNQKGETILVNGEIIKDFPYENALNYGYVALMDNVGNAYYVTKGKIKVTKSKQESRENHDKTPNSGIFTTAWIDHGSAPQNETYAYTILVQASTSELHAFAKAINKPNIAPYKIIQQTEDAHIVEDRASNTTAYVLFETHQQATTPHILANDHPCLIMVKEIENYALSIQMADPALNVETPKQLTAMDEVKQRLVTITVNGQYKLTNASENCKIIATTDKTTTLQFTCIHGLAINAELTK